MEGINPNEFLAALETVDGVTERQYTTERVFLGRGLYILQAPTGIPSNEAESTFDYWRNHSSFKTADKRWIELAGVPITELAVLLHEEDPIKGELRKDLGQGEDDSMYTSNPTRFYLAQKQGRIVRQKLSCPEDIGTFLSQVGQQLPIEA